MKTMKNKLLGNLAHKQGYRRDEALTVLNATIQSMYPQLNRKGRRDLANGK